MKLTPERIAALKKIQAYTRAGQIHTTVEILDETFRDLIADLEEARGMAVTLAPDALREAEERKNIAAGLEVIWQGRMRDAETAHQAELAATRKLLAYTKEALLAERNRREHFLEMANGIGCDSLTDVFKMVSSLRKQLAEAQSSDSVTVRYDLSPMKTEEALRAKVREFGWLDPDAAEGLRRELAEAQARNAQVLSVAEKMRCAGGPQEFQYWFDELKSFLLRKQDLSALDAAIVEAIEPYRKDAERLDLLGKLCKETPLRPNAFCSEIAPDTRLRYDFPTLVSYDSVGNQISLRDAIDAAIAAKGDSE